MYARAQHTNEQGPKHRSSKTYFHISDHTVFITLISDCHFINSRHLMTSDLRGLGGIQI